MLDYLDTNIFCYDLEKYLTLRGGYFDFTKEVPRPVVESAVALFNEIG
ncbi:hypothetical protein EUZ87_01270 [Lactiplantibacillus paraplantarum]|uniref:Uncharacterized protein n=1 Tax=Lactiplantibacillus paraplantarum TaxID=60520 RepID=A0A4Q9Y696_9LACO|nr:hypothetical protein EUZ87_01270 [Lactiplantibacillus paraplantarum]